MLLDIRKIFSTYDAPIHRSHSVDLAGEDFPGYTLVGPAQIDITAVLQGKVLQMDIAVRADISFACARCLEETQRSFCAEASYPVREADLSDPEAELPFTQDGKLDVRELAYTELVLQIPSVLLCSDDCAGLCPVCGCRKPCACTHETSGEMDERLAILKQLLS